MYYAPHVLYKKIEKEERDELGRIIADSERWVYVCDCRCDDNNTEQFKDENGHVFTPKYKIVCDRADVEEGEFVQCRVKDPLNDFAAQKVIGEGRVFNAPKCRYLNYMVLYV